MSVRYPSIALLLSAGLLVCASPALAGGNARIVDDATLTDPGDRQLEAWGTGGRAHHLAHIAHTCGISGRPLEFGAFVEYSRVAGDNDLAVGPSVKFGLRSLERGAGVAVSATTGLSVATGRMIHTSLIIPVTVDLNDRVRLNANAGWDWAHDTASHQALAGAQLEYFASPQIGLVAEAFAQSRGSWGYQAGLRWAPGATSRQIDLLFREDRNGSRARSLSLGLTVQR